jgi:outer membrane protein assembly factor BamE (lipoprotein component of BamABCDE complex)
VGSEDIERYYKTLHLEPHASFGEVKRAYRALVNIWHPDRFSQTPHMQQQALEKFQELNRAYAKIRAVSLPHRPHLASPSPPAQEAPNEPSTGRRGTSMGRIPLWAIALTAFVILRLVVVHVLIAFTLWPQPLPLIPSADVPWRPSAVSLPAGVQPPPVASPPVDAPAAQVSNHDAGLPPGSIAQPCMPLRYFTVGSTKAEVLAVQGPPTLAAARLWDYGGSRVFFRHDKVTRWEVWPRSPLKARLQPTAAVEPTPAYITVGSTKDEVLAIQGTPSRFSAQVWEFGPSRLYFHGDHVVRWEVWPRFPLKVRLLPDASFDTLPQYFTVGSTKDEVLSIQGTPSRFTERVWDYGQSRVYFDGDRVSRWHEWRGSPLKARLLLTDEG